MREVAGEERVASTPGEAITLKRRLSQFAVNCFPLSLGILYLFFPASRSFVLLAMQKKKAVSFRMGQVRKETLFSAEAAAAAWLLSDKLTH